MWVLCIFISHILKCKLNSTEGRYSGYIFVASLDKDEPFTSYQYNAMASKVSSMNNYKFS